MASDYVIYTATERQAGGVQLFRKWRKLKLNVSKPHLSNSQNQPRNLSRAKTDGAVIEGEGRVGVSVMSRWQMLQE